MIKKILLILITTITLTVNVNAASDGELLLEKRADVNAEDGDGDTSLNYALENSNGEVYKMLLEKE